MLKDVTVNLLPFVHTASRQNAFLFFSIITADRSREAGGFGELEDLGLLCATCSELRAPQAPRCLPGVCRGGATGGWGCPPLPPPLLPFLPWLPPLSALAGSGLVCNSGALLWWGVLRPILVHSMLPWLAVVLSFCGPDCTEQVPRTSALNCSLSLITGSSLRLVQTWFVFWLRW